MVQIDRIERLFFAISSFEGKTHKKCSRLELLLHHHHRVHQHRPFPSVVLVVLVVVVVPSRQARLHWDFRLVVQRRLLVFHHHPLLVLDQQRTPTQLLPLCSDQLLEQVQVLEDQHPPLHYLGHHRPQQHRLGLEVLAAGEGEAIHNCQEN